MTLDDHDEIYLHSSHQLPPLLVFFITGNPGLVNYYRSFLAHLFDRLQQSTSTHSIHVFATSLPGFELERSPPEQPHGPPYNLRETIAIVRNRLNEAIQRVRSSTPDSSAPIPVILAGHSVGSYILLETLASLERAPPSDSDFTLAGGICLFPTVVDLAKSRMGRRARYVPHIPFFALAISLLAKLLFTYLPVSAAARLVQAINGMPDDAAATTARFLKSRTGVRQALFLAQHELREMTHDRWSNELWGVTAAAKPAPPLYFYFGERDHWVADATRDALIASRAARQPSITTTTTTKTGPNFDAAAEARRPTMEIDRRGVPHDFCVRHGALVADTTAGYVENAVARLKG